MEIPAGDTRNDAAEPQEWLLGQEESDLVEIFPLGTLHTKRTQAAAIPPELRILWLGSCGDIGGAEQGFQSS